MIDDRMRIGELEVKRGVMAFGSLGELYLPDSSAVQIPLIVVRGGQDGPVLWVGSTMHGPEITGAEVIRRLCREALDPAALRGTVLAAPIINPFAFNAGVMNTPTDGYNLNRVFPGGDSNLSFRLAKLIWERGAQNADYIIDMHANPDPAIMFSIVKEGESEAEAASQAMAEAFGITTINMRQSLELHRAGTLTNQALDSGKPALTLELIRWRRMEEVSVEAGLRGVLNVMRQIGMLDGEIEPQSGFPIIPGRLSRVEVTASKGGLVSYLSSAGAAVQENQAIAILRDPYGDVVETIRSPVDGHILAYPLLGNQAAGTGDFVAFIAFPI